MVLSSASISKALSSSSSNLKDLRRIHALVISLGLERSSDFFSGKLIDKYSHLKDPRSSLSVFKRVSPAENVYLWNSIIRALSRNGLFSEALEFYGKLREANVSPDRYTFPPVVKACAGVFDKEIGDSVYNQIIELGFESDLYVGNAVVDMYSRMGFLCRARQVFDEMPVRDLVSWNSLISGFSSHGYHEEAVELYRELRRSSWIMPDSFTVTSVLYAFGNLLAVKEGEGLHGFVMKSGVSSVVVVNNGLLSMYLKLRRVTDARRVFDEMVVRDSVSYNTMISTVGNILIDVYAKCGDVIAARDVFKGMECKDTVSWNSLISGYIQSGDLLEDSLQIFNSMETRDTVTWNMVISACVRSGDFASVLQVTTQMRNSGVVPDMATFLVTLPMCASLAGKRLGKEIHCCLLRFGYESELRIGNALIEMYSKCGCLKSSLKVFEHMSRRDVVTWTGMIYAYGMYGEGEKALAAFADMEKEAGVVPDNVAFIAIIYACSHSGLVEQGLACFEKMKTQYKIEPVMEHYACVVDLLSRSQKISKAEEFIQAMPVKPDASVWASLLRACRTSGDMETAERVSKKIVELNPDDPGYSILASNAYAALRKWDKVSLIRKSLKDKERKKNPGYSWIEVSKKVYLFRAGDVSAPQFEAIHESLEMLYSLMAKEGYVPDPREVSQNLEEEEEKRRLVCGHSERLAIAFGLLNTEPGTPLQVMKNLRVCGDCHEVTKLISKIVGREILVRDANRFHLFKDGACSCNDRW
ncbi:BnaC05g48160D [Brassica napus]|uniref:BnaC05g48160D protein n=1 Tax=Brassica napus TaxID=3708 RepID=A0A078II20_BRANA|nr:BnaC05g48160D [Brassica napus]